MAVKGDKVYLKAQPQFFQPAGEPIASFPRNGAVPGDSIVNDWIPDNYDDCTYLGEVQEIAGKTYYRIRLNFSYQKHGIFGISKSVKSSEDLWFLEEDFSFTYVQTKEDIAEAKKEALKAQILSGTDASLTASAASSASSGNTVLIVAIVAGVGLLAGVLWWAFGKKKNAPPAPSQVPTIIQLSKPTPPHGNPKSNKP